MAITVNYSPVGISGQVANYAGQQQGKAAALQDALRVQGMVQNERQFNKQLQNRVWETQFRTAAQMRSQDKSIAANQQNLAAQMANRNRQMMFQQQAREREAQFNRMSRLEMLRAEEGMRNRLANQDWYRQREQAQFEDEQTKQMFEWKFTQAQKREQEDMLNKMNWVNSQTDWTDDQKADALQQLEGKYLGITPFAQPVEPPMFPEGREPGMIFEESGFRYTMRMDANGNPYVDELGPIAHDDTREFDNKPYRLGSGLYQKNSDGKVETIVPPLELDLMKIYDSAYETALSNAQAGAKLDQPVTVDEDDITKAAEARIKFLREQHEDYIDSVLGMQNGDEQTGTASPFNAGSGLYGPGEPPFPYQMDFPPQTTSEPAQGRAPEERQGGPAYGYQDIETADMIANDTIADLEDAIRQTERMMGREEEYKNSDTYKEMKSKQVRTAPPSSDYPFPKYGAY